MEDLEGIAWKNADPEDLWIFDKLIVARKLGYSCGPVGTDVLSPGHYIVRPCVNIPGMGRGASIQWIEQDTTHLPSGYFWCELFNGHHISVDYKDGQQVLAVEGFRISDELWKFSKWKKIYDVFPIPSIFYSLTKKYEYLNIEYIDGKAIEIHLRHNPDFVHGNSVAYPVWNDYDTDTKFDTTGLKYIDSPDFYRKGFWID
jgi:hypothetical protein